MISEDSDNLKSLTFSHNPVTVTSNCTKFSNFYGKVLSDNFIRTSSLTFSGKSITPQKGHTIFQEWPMHRHGLKSSSMALTFKLKISFANEQYSL